MSKTGGHAEDTDHELEHAGREVGEHFAESVSEPDDTDDVSLLDSDSPNPS